MTARFALVLVAYAHLRAYDEAVDAPPLGTVPPVLQREPVLPPSAEANATTQAVLPLRAEANATSGYDIASVAYADAGAGGCIASHIRAEEATAVAEQSGAVPQRQLSMYIAVMSLPQNVDRRDAVRQTWKKQIDPDPSVQVRFIICAKGAPRDQLVRVAEENTRYGDMDLLDCWEGYGHGNLTLKVYAAMERFANMSHAKKGEPSASVFMKVDDDTLLRAGAVLEVARRTSDQAAHFYMGYMFAAGTEPKREPGNRWYEPCEVFKGNKYPTTASGSAYAVSGSLVQRFVHQDVTAIQERLLWNEDRAVATWVEFEIEERHIPVTYVNLPGATNLQEAQQGPAEASAALTVMDDWRNLGLLVVHKLYPKQMICVWSRMQRGDAHAADCFAAAMKR